MAGKKTTKKPTPRKTPKSKVDKFVEAVAQDKSGVDAVLEAGWSQTRKAARVTASRLLSNANIAERVERRKAEAMRRAQIHTDVIVGSLAEIATSSLCDVLDENGEFDINKARENNTDHLIKKLKITKRTILGGEEESGILETKYEFEMYDRLNALNQLRDNFGMKQEPRPNSQAELESAISDFIRLAEEKGYQVTPEEARKFVEPRLASELVQ